MRFCFLALFGLAACFAFVGCSGGWGTASGTVTLDGVALKEGTITFHPEGEGATATGRISNGEFTISTGQKTGLRAGEYKVTIAHMTIPASGSSEQAKFLTPEKYSRPDTSGFVAVVKGGSNRFQYDMVTPAKP